MSGVKKKTGAAAKGKRPAKSRPGKSRNEKSRPEESRQEPDWTSSLKRLYDSVVEEPIPDAFKDLLNKLDSDKR